MFPVGTSRDEIERLARAEAAEWIQGKESKKVIYVEKKLLNFVDVEECGVLSDEFKAGRTQEGRRTIPLHRSRLLGCLSGNRLDVRPPVGTSFELREPAQPSEARL